MQLRDKKVSFSNPQSPIKPSMGNGSVAAAASDLIKLARAALQEKRLRDSLALTGAILKIDPGNKDAEVLRSWILTDLGQDFQKVLELANEARAQGDGAKWGVVRTSLRRLLAVIPDHEGAQVLLMEAQSTMPHFEPISPATPMAFMEAPPVRHLPRTDFLGIAMLVMVAGFGCWTFISSPPWTIRDLWKVENNGTLRLELEQGVQVFVDGEDWGSAPLQTRTLHAGRHRVTYKSAGILIDEEDVDILRNQTVSNQAGRTLGRIDFVVVPSSGVELTVDNEKIGTPPEFILLKPGLHELSLMAEGYEKHIRKVLVVAGQKSLVPVLLRESLAADK